MTTSLLDLPLVGAIEIAGAEAAVAALLGTGADVLLVQAEAIVALEATAKSLGRPGLRALNVVTGPYGALFGHWLTESGCDVVGLEVPFDAAATAADFREALNTGHFDLVAVVHAEAATGGANPLEEIAEMVQAHGALLVVDAVASVGGHPVTPDVWGADVVVIGGQKALAGPAGVSALSVTSRAWHLMDENPAAPRASILSLLDLRDGWLVPGKSAVLGMPSSLETTALNQALARVTAEGLDQVIGRHRAAAAATRAAIRQLGLAPWILDDSAAATVVTTVATPAGRNTAEVVKLARAEGSRILTAAPGVLAATTLRIGHTGRNANQEAVLIEIAALAGVLDRHPGDALAAAQDAWEAVLPAGV